MAAGHVIVVVVVALLGGGILNAQALTDAAARQPFGLKRTVAVIGATPFRGIAGLFGLDRPHALLAEAAVDLTGEPQSVGEQPVAAADAPVEPPVSQASPSPLPGETATPAPPSEAPGDRGTPTRKDPLRVWVGGDSLTSEFGSALSDRLARTQRSKAQVEFRFSSGLSRPDFFDWPSRLAAIARSQDPDLFIVMFGANDGQNIAVDGTVLEFGTGPWKAEYATRVGNVMDLLDDEGRRVLWIGQPIMRSPDFDAKMRVLNGIYRAQARRRDNVDYLGTRALFGDGGAFAAYLEDEHGQPALMRQQDGIHFTRAGGERLTNVVLEAMSEHWPLPGS